jgi:hypothetical protein
MAKPLRLLQEHHCPGKCVREDLEGDVCQHGTCEYNIHDPFNQAQKAELLASSAWLPHKPVKHVITMRPAIYRERRKR